MFATIERLQVIDEAERIAEMILQSDIYENYLYHIYKIKNNLQLQNKIFQFVQLKAKYEDVQRFGKYHPDYKLITKEVRELKRTLDLHDDIAAFKKSENEIQSILDEISVLVGKSVSEHIKVATGNPFFDQLSSCSGGCGSGGKCGCK